MTEPQTTRRELMGAIAAAGAAGVAGPAALAAKPAEGNKPTPPAAARRRPWALGLTSYMFKQYTLDQTLAMARRVDVTQLCLRSNLLAIDATPEQIASAKAKVKAAGMAIYGGGVIYMRTEGQMHQAFAHAKAVGYKLISISLTPDLLGLLDKKVREHDIRAAIHNHGPGDKHWATPQIIYEKIKKLDKRIGICHDTGHTMRSGVDPVAATRKTADRILDLHLKDVDAATAQGRSVEFGRGIVDLPGMLNVLREIGFKGVLGLEYEKNMDDLLPGLAECAGYARGLMDAMGAKP